MQNDTDEFPDPGSIDPAAASLGLLVLSLALYAVIEWGRHLGVWEYLIVTIHTLLGNWGFLPHILR